MLSCLLFLASILTIPTDTVEKAFNGHPGAFVLIDCSSGEIFRSSASACAEKIAPCSTFKIWNSAIGLETGVVTDPDAPFWKWDGKKRQLDGWNKDQTLRSAIAVSCVPAYQNLARNIGPERMQKWLDKIGYGDRNISAGIDVFWLPQPGRKTLLISPEEQAEMIARLVKGELPFSSKTLVVLKSILTLKTTERGTLYGKTGSGTDDKGDFGWFVGYVESKGQTYAFACLLKGAELTGKDARAATENILMAQRLL
jgi:beta-lactamase class D